MKNILVVVANNFELEKLLERLKGNQFKFKIGKNEKVELVQITINNKNIFISNVGVGLVKATLFTNIILESILIDSILIFGLAGSLEDSIHVCDIVISDEVLQYDSIYSGKSGIKLIKPGCELTSKLNGPDPFIAIDKNLVNLVFEALTSRKELKLKVNRGLIITGSEFMCTTERKREIKNRIPKALAIDMETSAIIQTAAHYNIPAVAIKTISDTVVSQSTAILKDFVFLLDQSCSTLALTFETIVDNL